MDLLQGAVLDYGALKPRAEESLTAILSDKTDPLNKLAGCAAAIQDYSIARQEIDCSLCNLLGHGADVYGQEFIKSLLNYKLRAEVIVDISSSLPVRKEKLTLVSSKP